MAFHRVQPSCTPLVLLLVSLHAGHWCDRTSIATFEYCSPPFRILSIAGRGACRNLLDWPLPASYAALCNPPRFSQGNGEHQWRGTTYRTWYARWRVDLSHTRRIEGRFQPSAVHDLVRNERICLIYVCKQLFIFAQCQSMRMSSGPLSRPDQAKRGLVEQHPCILIPDSPTATEQFGQIPVLPGWAASPPHFSALQVNPLICLTTSRVRPF